MTQKKVPYELDKTKFEGVLVYDDSPGPRPGLVLVPNWLGINAANLKQAELVAGRGYVVFVADVYGVTGRPKDQGEAGKAAGALKGDRGLLRKRMQKSLETFLATKLPQLDANRVGAIGFCFGGTAALELARTGAKLGGVVSFHGGLGSPTPDDAKNITAKILALHGADDPAVPADEVTAFQNEMRAAKIDWQLVSFGNTVHSFTDVDANTPGRSQYNPVSAARAYALMDSFFAEVFKPTRP
ncbi:MAG TPA: dienelactone hydrolase family protein [Archangium sp.]